ILVSTTCGSGWLNADIGSLSNQRSTARYRRPAGGSDMARVPGVGLLNRTCKSWVERHEVQLLRGLPKLILCGVAHVEEHSSHKRKGAGSTPASATNSRGCDLTG